MENTFFLCSEKGNDIEVVRFHICSWEFNDNETVVEFGGEIDKSSVKNVNKVHLELFIPWLNTESKVTDLYEQLCKTVNSRFIFNDFVKGSESFDGGANKIGIIHKFQKRDPLCIIPIALNVKTAKKVIIDIDLKAYNNYHDEKPNIYFRFCIHMKGKYLSTRKLGINKSTIIYDIKINEERNIPLDQLHDFTNKEFCKIKVCFCFNILSSSYDMVFPDSSLKSVRTLEYPSFSNYLGKIINIPKDELMVVFNKRNDTFTFFSIYTQERIGPSQFASAILINIICGVLLFIPSYRKSFTPEISLKDIWFKLPFETYISIAFAFLTFGYFIWPTLVYYCKSFISLIKRLVLKNESTFRH